jgi:RNA polymerase sigma-70 factor (ECF subfamily)
MFMMLLFILAGKSVHIMHLRDSDAMKQGDYTDMGGTGASFLTTHWSIMEKVGSAQDIDNKALVGLLLERYWKPVYCYLRRQGYDNEDAKDLTQGFFHEIVIGHHLVEMADKSKGRFRSYLLVSLDRYLIKVRQKQQAQKRIPQEKLIPLNVMNDADIPSVVSELNPEESFNYAWISTLLEEVLQQVESQCHQDDLSTHWYLFRDRILEPILTPSSPPSLEVLCSRYQVDNTAKASNMVITIKRRFGSALQKHLRDLVASDEQVREELEEIKRFFPSIAQDCQ